MKQKYLFLCVRKNFVFAKQFKLFNKVKILRGFRELIFARPVRTLRTYNYQLTVLRVSSIQEKRNFEKQIFIKTHLGLSEVEP